MYIGGVRTKSRFREVYRRKDQCFCDRLHADARGPLSVCAAVLAGVYRATDPRLLTVLHILAHAGLDASLCGVYETCGDEKIILSDRVQIYAYARLRILIFSLFINT